MVYIPSFQGLNSNVLTALEEYRAAVEKQRQAVKAVQQFPTKEFLTVRETLADLQPALRQMHQMDELLKTYQDQFFPAAEVARELVEQMEQVRGMLRDVQSVIKAIQQITPYQWAAIAGFTGVSTTAPLWMTVPGIAPPIVYLPELALPQLASVLAGEAGRAAEVLLSLGVAYAEKTLEDEFYKTLTIWLVAGLIVFWTESKQPASSIERWAGRLPLIFEFIRKFLLPGNGE